jgi:predicted peptidase
MKTAAIAVLTSLLLACGGSGEPTYVVPPVVDTTGTGAPVGGTPGFKPPAGGGFILRSMTASGVAFPYQVFSPASWSATKKWPIIVSFAGSGERGSDGYLQLDDGLALVVKAQQANFPAVVIFPQAPLTTLNQEPQFDASVLKQIDQVVADYNGDPTRIYLVGFSAGGTIAMDFAFQQPTKFAALANISGGICTNCVDPTGTMSHPQAYAVAAQVLKAMPVRVYHGATDTSLPVTEIRILASAFTAIGANFKYIEYANAGHAIWDNVFALQDFYDWMFAQHR